MKMFNLPKSEVNSAAQLLTVALPAIYSKNQLRTPTDEQAINLLVDHVLQTAIRFNASDIHLEPAKDEQRLRYRIDGLLHEQASFPMNLHASMVNRIRVLADLDIADRRAPQDGRISLKQPTGSTDLRVSIIPSSHGESVVMRIQDQQKIKMDYSQLGLSLQQHALFTRLLKQQDGMILVTGPTGSGKTTTLYSCIHTLNHMDHKIITAEDPIEYQLAGVNQVPIQPEIGLTFPATLRAILRQAPDTIIVGEIRDQETAQIALQAGLTGHRVLSTLHTTDAPGTIGRLLDMGVKPYLIAATLKGVLAQRLVRKLCLKCREAYRPDASEWELFSTAGIHVDQLYRPVGCPYCLQTGYSGRTGVFELLHLDKTLTAHILTAASVSKIYHLARLSGMVSLAKNALLKSAKGITSLTEALRISDKDEAYDHI